MLRTWLAALATIVVGPGLFADDRANVVWIIADDLSPELGCYGYAGVATPHIDRLAAAGARYTNAFTTAPVCSPSRSALITGVFQTSTGTHQHRTTNKLPLPKPVEPITALMRRAGYFVCNSNATMNRSGKTDYNFKFAGKMFDAADWSIGKKGRKPGQPFFVQVQIHEPHRDFVPASDATRAQQVQIPAYYPEHPVIRADWANYLASIEVLDRHVGAVIDRLEREQLADNTVVFFFGDHGRPHYRDKQWLYDGGIRVPLLVRWPRRIKAGDVRDQLVSLLDVTAATLAVAGINTPAWMDGQDMLADGYAGRELIFAARDRCGNTLDRIRCVRTKRFKYIRNFYPDRPYTQHSGYKELQYPGMTVARVLKLRGELTGPAAQFWADRRPAEELYDLSVDPEELNNVADDPGHAATLTSMRNHLQQWIKDTDDQGRIAEVGVKATVESSNRWYRGKLQQRGLSADIKPADYLKWWETHLGLSSP
jgi:uncharacterized sulfatase